MLLLQGFPLCEDVLDLTPEELIWQESMEAEYRARRQAKKAHKRANGKRLKKNSNASLRRLWTATER